MAGRTFPASGRSAAAETLKSDTCCSIDDEQDNDLAAQSACPLRCLRRFRYACRSTCRSTRGEWPIRTLTLTLTLKSLLFPPAQRSISRRAAAPPVLRVRLVLLVLLSSAARFRDHRSLPPVRGNPVGRGGPHTDPIPVCCGGGGAHAAYLPESRRRPRREDPRST